MGFKVTFRDGNGDYNYSDKGCEAGKEENYHSEHHSGRVGQKFWILLEEFLEGSWDVPLVYRFVTDIVGLWLLLKLEEKAILCLIVAQRRGVATIFLQPKEPLTIDLLLQWFSFGYAGYYGLRYVKT